jgi:ligand-binding sensor domain-containing protein/two-component sensor histidine kinase
MNKEFNFMSMRFEGSKKMFLYFGLFILSPLFAYEQKTEEPFPFRNIEYYDSKQGFSGSNVWWATQDKHGFLWFMTDNLLYRFDGYFFRSYSNDFDAKSIRRSEYWGISEDNEGKLWIPGTWQGLYSYDPYHEKFRQHRHPEGDPQSFVSDMTAQCIAADGNGDIWIGCQNGLDRFDQASGLFRHFVHKDNDSTTLTSDNINGLFFDEHNNESPSDNLWLIYNDAPGIDCFNKKTGKLFRHYLFPFAKAAAKWGRGPLIVNGIRNNTIWIGSDDEGLYGFNVLSKEFVQINFNHPCRSAKHRSFYSVMEDHAGNLWTCDDDNNIVYYDRPKNKFYFFPVKMDKVKYDLSGMIFEDRSQKIWFCTNKGLISVDTKQKRIVFCQPDGAGASPVFENSVCGIRGIKGGPLFVCSGRSIHVFDRVANSFSPFMLSENGKNFWANGTFFIFQDSRGIIWFSGFSGIRSYDPLRKKSRFHLLTANSTPLDSFRWIGVLEDKKGRYWSVNEEVGLCQFDPATDNARIIGRANLTKAFPAGEIFEDSRGIFYIYRFEGGFTTYNPDSGKFKVYHHDANDPSSVGNESCHAWIESKNHLIWFGTSGGGIGVFDPATEKFKTFTTNDGLVQNNVASLTADKNGHYWAGTYGGLSCFMPPDDPFAPGCKITFHNYDIGDGLPSNLMNVVSAYCDTDGTMLFGTRDNGMFYFHPDDLKDNEFIPPVYVTEFRLQNKLVSVSDSNSVLQSPIEFTKEIRLNYKQNIISFSFAALNYTRPEKNQYQYMLENYDKDWVVTDASRRFANYTNLDPGTYIFKVKGSNNDGVWNETPTEIKIIITPPFWQTTWFKALIALAAMGIVYAFYRYRIRQLVLLQRIRNKIAADLHDDIGSTLNSIALYSDLAKTQPRQRDYALAMIAENARKIIDSMSDIVWMINPKNDSFDKIIFRMRSLTHDMLKTKKIECQFKYDETLNDVSLPMGIRRNIYLIFKEALNNMIKYSNATKASIKMLHENKNMILIISDNGIGFDRSLSHNGNGLVNMAQRAEEIGAKINIESEQGVGTNIELNVKL